MITLRHPEETLAILPHITGYRPRHHLVFCGLDQHGADAAGMRACMGPIAVIDHTEERLSIDHARFVADIVRLHRVSKAVIVFYCDDLDENLDENTKTALRSIHSFAMAAMSDIRHGFLASFAVDLARFVRIDASDRRIRPLSEVESMPAAAELVYRGSCPADSPPSVDIEAKPAEARAAAAGAAVAPARPEEGLAAIDLLLDRATLGGLEARKPRDGGTQSGESLFGRASAALCLQGVRDRVLLYGIDPSVGTPLSDVDDGELFDRLAIASTRPPDIDRLRATTAMLEETASYRAPGEHAALAAAAYLHWWACSNSMASRRVREAIRIEPGYPLAELLLDVVTAGVMAPWYDPWREVA